jgi:hypothetical protein
MRVTVRAQEAHHLAVEHPRLLDVTGVSRSGYDDELGVRQALLQGSGRGAGGVELAGQDQDGCREVALEPRRVLPPAAPRTSARWCRGLPWRSVP